MLRRLFAILAVAGTALVVPSTAAHADKTYRGQGDQVVRIRATKNPGLLKFTHDGESNFIVWAVNPAGKKDQLLTNEIGPYKGTVLYNDRRGKGIAALEIKADGAWTATFQSLKKARCWCSATIRGTGDQVLKLSTSRALRTVAATHRGESNFIVWGYDEPGTFGDLLFNRIGDYRGKALLPGAVRLVTVKADGPWTLRRR